MAAWCNVTMGATRPARPDVACRLDRKVRPACKVLDGYSHERDDATDNPGQVASHVNLECDGAGQATYTEDYDELAARRSTAARSVNNQLIDGRPDCRHAPEGGVVELARPRQRRGSGMSDATREQGGDEELMTREETGIPFSASRNLCRAHGNSYSDAWAGLTFEVSRVRRQGVPAAWCNIAMGATRPVQPAVACRLDRGVSWPHCLQH
jgi:hypothetical protein